MAEILNMNKTEEGTKVEVDSKEAFNGSADLKRKVTRKEFIEVLQQVAENISDIAGALQADVNGMYRNMVYPLQVRYQALENLICRKFDISESDISKEVYNIQKELLEKAKESGEVVTDKTGTKVTSEEETKEHEEKIVKDLSEKNS